MVQFFMPHSVHAPTHRNLVLCSFKTIQNNKWINSGTIKILFMISEHSYREPEVGVKFCMINFSKLVYCKVFLMRA